MPGFQFRLQRVLNFREHVEKGTAREVGVALKELERRENLLRELQDVRDDSAAQFETRAGDVVAAGRLVLLNSALEQLQHVVDEAEEACLAARKNLDAAIQRHVEARRNRETLARLRAKAHREWFVDEVRAEQKEMDEVARTMSFSRR